MFKSVFVCDIANCVPENEASTKVKFGFLNVSKSVHFLLISDQNTRIFVNFFTFLPFFAIFRTCALLLLNSDLLCTYDFFPKLSNKLNVYFRSIKVFVFLIVTLRFDNTAFESLSPILSAIFMPCRVSKSNKKSYRIKDFPVCLFYEIR